MPWRVVLALVLASSLAAADPSADARKRAIVLFEEGRALAAQGKDAEACDRFVQSLELEPALGTELNLADCLQRQGHLRRAWGYYDHVATVSKREGDAVRAKFARERADAVVPQLATVNLKLAEPSVHVTLNHREVEGDAATRAELVDPGEVEVEASAPDRRKFVAKVTVAKARSVDVTVPALAKASVVTASSPGGGGGRRKRGWVYTSVGLAGLTVIDLGFAAIATNTALHREDEYESHSCSLSLATSGSVGDACRRRLRELHEWQNRALWSTLVGVALAGSATLIYIVAPTERVTITPTASATEVGVTLSARF